MTTKKLDKEHLDAITVLQEKFTQNTNTVGSIAIELEFLETQKQSLTNRKSNLIQQFMELREEETKLIDSLKERYGDGHINILEGVFVSADVSDAV